MRSSLIYLDNHATTAVDPAVVEAMLPTFTEAYGNAGSRQHIFGMRAKALAERAREQVAELIGASPKEILFTSGATESNNLAILGGARALAGRGRHLVTVATEHKAVLDPCEALQAEGFEVTVLPVDADGLVTVEAVEAALRPDTVLVSVMAANNEIGTLQPIEAIGALCRDRGVLFHTDAAQAAGRVPLDVQAIGCDLLSLTAHKVHGPKGIGALYVRRGRPRVKLLPLQHGGGQERGMRPGTLPVPLAVGLGKAAELARAELQGEGVTQLRALRDQLWQGLQQRVEGVRLNGSWAHRLPHNLNVAFPGVEAAALMMGLKQVAISSGSACSSATLQPSHVLRAIGLPDALGHASIRFGVGRFNTADEIERVVELVADKVAELRALGPLYEGGSPHAG